MAKTGHEKDGTIFVEVSMKVEKELMPELGRLELEGCRNVREVVNYLLDVICEVSSQWPAFRIRPREHSPSVLTGSTKLHLPENLYDKLNLEAKAYGVGLPEITRVFLWMGFVLHIKLVPKGTMVKKEEFARLVRRELEKQNRRGNCLHTLRIIWQTFLRR